MMLPRSFAEAILLVACGIKAVKISSSSMPEPSSGTDKKLMPPFLISTVMFFAPASIAFSMSSLTAEAGRETTSPAAIIFETLLSKTCILAIWPPPYSVALFLSSFNMFNASIGVSAEMSIIRSLSIIPSRAPESSES